MADDTLAQRGALANRLVEVNKELRARLHERDGQVAALRAAGQRVMDCVASEALTGRGQPGLGAVAGLQLALIDTASVALKHDAALVREGRKQMKEEAARYFVDDGDTFRWLCL